MRFIVTLTILFILMTQDTWGAVAVRLSVKDEERLGTDAPLSTPPLAPSPAPSWPQQDQGALPLNEPPAEDQKLSDFQPIELNLMVAEKALDAFAAVEKKYRDSAINRYETIEDFVKESEDGKHFEEDIKKFGFTTVTEWNRIVITIQFAYSARVENLEESIKIQVQSITDDKNIEEPIKQKIITSLNAMHPSEHNKRIIDSLLNNKEYAEKLKLLSEESQE